METSGNHLPATVHQFPPDWVKSELMETGTFCAECTHSQLRPPDWVKSELMETPRLAWGFLLWVIHRT